MSFSPLPWQEEVLVPGASLIGALDFADAIDGAGAREGLLERLPPAEAAVIRVAQPTGWYPLDLRGALIRALCAGREPSLARDLGRFEAARDLAGRRRCFFDVMPLDVAVLDMNVFWRGTQTAGTWTSEVTEGGIVARLDGWQAKEPLLCLCLAGYLEQVLMEGAARGTLVAVEHSRCRALGDAICEFRTAFSPTAAPAPGTAVKIAPCDVQAIVGQLTSIGDLVRVADATLALLQRLAFSRVTLRLHHPALTRSTGAAGGGVVHRFPLRNGGHAIGWIEVEDAHGAADFASLDELLLNLLAVALHGCGICPELALQNRARDWNLTKREFEALVLVVRGNGNQAIAAKMDVSVQRVEALLTSLFKKSKTNGKGRAALIAAACDPQGSTSVSDAPLPPG